MALNADLCNEHIHTSAIDSDRRAMHRMNAAEPDALTQPEDSGQKSLHSVSPGAYSQYKMHDFVRGSAKNPKPNKIILKYFDRGHPI